MTTATNPTSRRYWPFIAGFVGLTLLATPLGSILLILFLVGALTVWGVRRSRGNSESFLDMFKKLAPDPAPVALAAAPAKVPALAGPIAASHPDHSPAADATPPVPLPEEIRLGTDAVNGQPIGLYPDELQQHGLLLGATGSGKTTTLLKITDGAAALGIPIVAIDLKGSPSFASQLERIASRHGRGFVRWSLSGDTHWNPLARGDASELKDKLVGMEAWSEPHYKRAAERYLQTVFTILDALGETPSLQRVVDLMDTMALNATLRDVPKALADRTAAYLDQLAHSSDQRSAVAGLSTRLALLGDSTAGDLLASPTDPAAEIIDIGQRIRAGDVCLFSLDSLRYPELAPQVAGLVIQDLKTVASEMLTDDDGHRALVAIDEFSALDGDQLLGMLARAREANIGVLLSTQELADLAKVAPTFADQVIANTNVKLIHRQEVPESAERLAGTIGTYQAWEHTFAEHDPLAELWTGVSSVTGTRRLVDKYTIHPNTFKTLRTGEAVLSIKAPEAAAGVINIDPDPDSSPLPMQRSLTPPSRPQPSYEAPPTVFHALGQLAGHVRENGVGVFFGAGQK